MGISIECVEGKKFDLLWENISHQNFGISQLLYCASSIHLPHYVIKEANKMLFQFIWSSKKEKVKRTTITRYGIWWFKNDRFTESDKGFENKVDNKNI